MHATFHNHASADVSLEQPPTAEDRRRLRRLPLFAGANEATVQDLLARTPISVAQRQSELYPFPPPGATEIVTQR